MNKDYQILRVGQLLTALVVFASFSAHCALWTGFRAPAKAVVEHEKGFLWLEAEEFSDYGTWVIDTQFVGKMGSAYLLGSGVPGCCANATTKLSVPRDGKWRAWARTPQRRRAP